MLSRLPSMRSERPPGCSGTDRLGTGHRRRAAAVRSRPRSCFSRSWNQLLLQYGFGSTFLRRMDATAQGSVKKGSKNLCQSLFLGLCARLPVTGPDAHEEKDSTRDRNQEQNDRKAGVAEDRPRAGYANEERGAHDERGEDE